MLCSRQQDTYPHDALLEAFPTHIGDVSLTRQCEALYEYLLQGMEALLGVSELVRGHCSEWNQDMRNFRPRSPGMTDAVAQQGRARTGTQEVMRLYIGAQEPNAMLPRQTEDMKPIVVSKSMNSFVSFGVSLNGSGSSVCLALLWSEA